MVGGRADRAADRQRCGVLGSDPVTARERPWTPAEDRIVLACGRDEAQARLPDRSPYAISRRRRELLGPVRGGRPRLGPATTRAEAERALAWLLPRLPPDTDMGRFLLYLRGLGDWVAWVEQWQREARALAVQDLMTHREGP